MIMLNDLNMASAIFYIKSMLACKTLKKQNNFILLNQANFEL